ncbi:MAG: glutamate--tRNA ligase [Candidatus Paceibacterota bacterium]|jgi:glutamyl-tRNA synthetase|nr:glutamate--tRNA ligase [Candidatus Paceibacterota bacterium]
MDPKQENHILPKDIIEKLFPYELPTPEELEKKYPPRYLQEGAMVTRVGPSPTGLMHIGGVYSALISERLAHQTKGVFYLRIEDTDELRSKAETTEVIVKALDHFDIPTDEGMTISGEEKGKYGPYTQSARKDIYRSMVRSLVEKGKAYPCFCTGEETKAMGEEQMKQGLRPGYYGKWAKWRDAAPGDVSKELEKGTPFVIRLRSEGNFENKIKVHDLLKGDLELSENDIDKKILTASSGLPTYHLAHAVDDHFMGTTDVIRGDEWVSSVPLHLQLFDAFGWKAPRYGHLAPIQKMDGGSKRKISKRKDPEANAMLYKDQGYPPEAVVEYLLNLANSAFEDWRKANPKKDNREFELTLKGLSKSNGPLFDFVKLNDISKDIVSRMSADEIYEKSMVWAKEYDPKLAEEMEKNSDYTKSIFNIERMGEARGRKDIGKWADMDSEIGYFFDPLFDEKKPAVALSSYGVAKEERESIVGDFLETYNENDTKDEWFEKIKDIARKFGYAEGAKQYKLEPEKYKGQVGDVAKIFRVLLTGKTNTPDLYSIMKVMGKERVVRRLKDCDSV